MSGQGRGSGTKKERPAKNWSNATASAAGFQEMPLSTILSQAFREVGSSVEVPLVLAVPNCKRYAKLDTLKIPGTLAIAFPAARPIRAFRVHTGTLLGALAG